MVSGLKKGAKRKHDKEQKSTTAIVKQGKLGEMIDNEDEQQDKIKALKNRKVDYGEFIVISYEDEIVPKETIDTEKISFIDPETRNGHAEPPGSRNAYVDVLIRV